MQAFDSLWFLSMCNYHEYWRLWTRYREYRLFAGARERAVAIFAMYYIASYMYLVLSRLLLLFTFEVYMTPYELHVCITCFIVRTLLKLQILIAFCCVEQIILSSLLRNCLIISLLYNFSWYYNENFIIFWYC